MNKAKFLLTATVALTIVGSALAIKAKRAVNFVYTSDALGNCTIRVFERTTSPGGAFITTTLITTIFREPCLLQADYIGT